MQFLLQVRFLTINSEKALMLVTATLHAGINQLFVKFSYT
jgi:hypothetical protein